MPLNSRFQHKAMLLYFLPSARRKKDSTGCDVSNKKNSMSRSPMILHQKVATCL
ncbi:unnamed protein product [Brassica rapa subsp. trilocularis]